jgi:hypothetical protein
MVDDEARMIQCTSGEAAKGGWRRIEGEFTFVLMLGHGRHDIDLGRGLSCSLKVVPGAA